MSLIFFFFSIHFLYFVYALIFLIIALKVRRDYLKGGKIDPLLKSFMMVFFFWAAFELMRALPQLSLIFGREDLFPQIMRWGYIISNIFLTLSAAYAVIIPTYFYWPKYQKLGIGLVLFFGALCEIILIRTPFTPEYHMGGGFTLMNPPPNSLPPLGIYHLIGFGLTAITFLYEAIKEVKGILRSRALLIGIGILIAIIIGPSHNLFRTALGTLFIDMISLIGKLLIAVGVILFKPKQKTTRMSR